MWMSVGVLLCSAGGVLHGRHVAVSDRLKEEQRTRVMELLQQLGGVSACVGVAVGVRV